MRRRLTQTILCQLASVAFVIAFVVDVRGAYREAILEQGGEYARQDIVDGLREAGVDFPEGFRTFPEKGPLIAPDLIQLGQNIWFLFPAGLLQLLAVLLVAKLKSSMDADGGDDESRDSA